MRSPEPAPVSAKPERCAPCQETVKQTQGPRAWPRDYFVRIIGMSVHMDTLESARAELLFVWAEICTQPMGGLRFLLTQCRAPLFLHHFSYHRCR